MGEKPVTDLSGIGEVLGKKLEDQGFDKAYVVLGQYLLLKKNDELFCNWLKETCGANKKQQADCAKCLKEWCESFMSLWGGFLFGRITEEKRHFLRFATNQIACVGGWHGNEILGWGEGYGRSRRIEVFRNRIARSFVFFFFYLPHYRLTIFGNIHSFMYISFAYFSRGSECRCNP